MRKVTIPGGIRWTVDAVPIVPHVPGARVPIPDPSAFPDPDHLPMVVELIAGDPRVPTLHVQMTPEHALELSNALRLESLVILASEVPTCCVKAEADGTEDGFQPYLCGKPAVLVDVESDLGYCAEHTMNATGTVTVLA